MFKPPLWTTMSNLAMRSFSHTWLSLSHNKARTSSPGIHLNVVTAKAVLQKPSPNFGRIIGTHKWSRTPIWEHQKKPTKKSSPSPSKQMNSPQEDVFNLYNQVHLSDIHFLKNTLDNFSKRSCFQAQGQWCEGVNPQKTKNVLKCSIALSSIGEGVHFIQLLVIEYKFLLQGTKILMPFIPSHRMVKFNSAFSSDMSEIMPAALPS